MLIASAAPGVSKTARSVAMRCFRAAGVPFIGIVSKHHSTRSEILRLFDEEKDAITVIKWKEVLDLLEEATDRCEDCANVLEGVVVKHG